MVKNLCSKLQLFFIFAMIIFISGCGEVVGTKDYSTVVTSEIGWKNVPDINTINISNFPLNGTCTPQAGTVIVRVGAPMMATQTLNCDKGRFSGSIDLSVVGIPEGMTELWATQSVISAEAQTNLWVDTVIPSAPVIISPASASTIVTRTVIVDGTCEPGATINFSGDVTSSTVVTNCTGGVFSGTVNITNGDGSKTINVTQTDSSGNTSPAASVTITLDTTVVAPPVSPIITSPTNSTATNTTVQTIIGTCEDGATVNVSGSVTLSPVSSVCAGGNYNIPVTLTAGNGVKIINVNQTNAGGTSPSTTITVVLDTVPPSAPIITSPTNLGSVNSVNQTVVGTCETGATVSINGNLVGGPITSICVGGNYSEVINLVPGDGPKVIDVTQTDPAGNTSLITSITVNLDTVAPLAPVITSPSNLSIVNNTSQTIIGTCETGATLNISGNIVGSPVSTTCIAGNYTRSVTLVAGDGVKNISVRQTDPAGNISPSTSVSLTLDTTIPIAPTITSPTSASTVNVVSQTVSGACETGANVSITGNIVGSPIVLACVAGNYSQPVTLVAGDGVKNISVRQTDPAGNISPNTNISITLDSTAPVAPTITSPTNSSLVNNIAQTVVGTCETGSTVNISGNINGSPVTATCVAGNYTRAVTLTSGDGVKNISVIQTDVGGNTSPSTSIVVTLDTTIPLAPTITSPTNLSTVNVVAQTVVGTCETGTTVNITGNIVGSPITTTCTAGNYSQAVNLIAGDGIKSIVATQTDLAGNTSANTTISITLDGTGPAAPTVTSPTNSSSVNTTAQTVIGTCEIGATVQITGNIVGSPVALACPAGNYSQPVTLVAGDGVKNISVTQTDAGGNVSPTTSVNITLDTIAPLAPVISSPSNLSSVNTVTQTVIGTCEAGATLSLSGNILGSPVSGTCVAGNYSQAVTLTAGDGVKNISVTQTDAAGNTSPSAAVNITLDTTAPSAPVITAPSNGIIVGSVSQTVTGNCEVGGTVNLSGNILGSPVSLACLLAGTFSQAVTLTAGDGVKNISATQTDSVGNTSVSSGISVTLDTSAPLAPTITSPAGGIFTNVSSQTITGVCETGATLNLSGNIVGSPQSSVCVGGVYSEVVTLTVGDGPKTITANQTDSVGNTSTNTSITINYDTTAPAAPVITSPANNFETNVVAQTLVGTCEAGASLSISGNITGSPVTATCVAGNFNQAINLTLGDGSKNISVTQTDAAGNTSSSNSINVILDTLAPLAPTITSPTNGSIVVVVSQTIVGTCDGNSPLSIFGNITGSPIAATCVVGSYSQAVTLTAADGVKNISVTQSDLAGNISPAASISLNLDTTTPIAPTITSPSDNSYVNNVNQTIVGTCESGATVNISGNIIGAPVTRLCTATGNYSQVVTLTAGDGVKNISATQTDVGGNTSPSIAINITLDTIAPLAPTISSPVNNIYTSNTAHNIIGTCEGNLTLSISGDITGSPVAATCVAGNYSRAVTLISGDGVKSISVTQTDLAGNISPAASININLDTTSPLAPVITSPSNNSYTNLTAQTIVGTCEGNSTMSISGNITGSPVAATCVAGNFSQAVTLTAIDGAKNISVTQTDSAGNISPVGSIIINLDVTTPAAPVITSPVDNIYTNLTVQTLVGTCEGNLSLSISGDIMGSPVAASCMTGSFSRSVTLTAANGLKTVSITQTDLAGNVSPADSVTINLDTINPIAPTITSPVNGSIINNVAQTVTGSCESTATVNLSGNIVGAPVTTACAAGSYSQTITISGGDGAKTITATQTDLAGNISPSASITVTLDTGLPAAPTITAPANNIYTNITTHSVSGVCETGATLNLLGNIIGAPQSSVCVGGTYSEIITLTAGDGAKIITANQTDTGGNTSPNASITINLDTAAPLVPVITSPSNNIYTNLTAQTIIGTCEGNIALSISGNITGSPISSSCVAGNFSQAVTLTAGDGVKNISVTQTDLAGNVSPAASITINLDATAPAAPVITSPANNSYTTLTAQTIVGTCEGNLALSITGNITGSPLAASCVAGIFSQAITLTAVDGAKNISITQTDLSGNVSPAASIIINLDSAAPSAPVIISPANNSYTNSTAQTIVGTCEGNISLTITGNITGSPVAASCVAGNFSRAVTLTAGDGAKNISVTQTDLAGNVSPAASITVNLDSTVPSAPVITSPTNNSYTNSTAQTIVGTCEGNLVLSISGNIIGSPVAASCVAGSFSQAVTLTALDGAKNISVTQTDLAGNTSAAGSITINLDSTVPAAPLITSPSNNSFTNLTAQTIVGTCEGNLSLSISGNITGSPVAASCVVGSFSQAVTLTALDGAKNVSVTQTDLAGNISAAANIIINLDTTSPVAPVITSPSNNSYTNLTAQTIIGTCEGNISLSISGNITGSPVAASCVAGSFSQAVTLTAGDGAKNLSVIQTDLAGNISPAAAIIINLDTIAPAAPVIASPTNNIYTNLTAQTIIGTCEGNLSLSITGNIIGSPVAASCVAGSFSQGVTLTAADGAKNISVTQTDLAGNTSPAGSIIINLDASAPLAPVITSPANNSSTNLTAQTLIGTCEGNLTLSISGNIAGSPVAASCVAGSFSQAVTLTAGDGVKNISATQTDLAGNISPSASLTINLDSSAPLAPVITSPSDNINTNTTAQTIIGTCEGNLTISISGNIAGSPVAGSCVAGSFSRVVTLTAGDGAKSVSVTQTDLAGNTSPAAAITINLDTTAPAVPVITSPTNSSHTNNTAQTVIGTCEGNLTLSIFGNITGSPVASACVAGSFSQAVTLVTGDGIKTISVTQTDLAGNTSSPATININLDTVAPATPTITSPANNSFTNILATSITGTCTSGLPSVTLTGDFNPSPVSVGCAAGSYTRAVTLLAGDGTKTITATQADLAGNISLPSTITITLDTSAPLAPVITSPANNSYTNNTSQTIIGTCEGNITLSFSGNITGSPVAGSCVAGSFSQALTLTAANGVKTISVTQTDLAGNTSPSSSINLNLDTVAPSAPTITSPADNIYTNLNSQTIQGACETGATLSLSGNIVGSPQTSVCVGGLYSELVSLTAVDGAKTVTATQTDISGNVSAGTTITINLDTTNPVAPVITSPTNNSYTNTLAQTIVGTCEGNLSLSITGNITGSPVAASCVAGSFSQAVSLTASNGAKTVSVTQTDFAGNVSPTASITLNLDNSVPLAPTISSPANNSYTNTTSQTIVGTCEGNLSLSITGNITGSPVAASCVAGSYSQAVTLTAGDAAKNVSVTQTDLAGNTSPAASLTINLDTSAPIAPSITSPANNSYSNNTSQTIVGTCETNAMVSISGDITGSPVNVICTAGSYSQAVTLTAANGAKSISVLQTDLANNTSPSSSITINLDTVIPLAPVITSPANNSHTNSTARTIVGTCEGNLNLTFTGDFTGSPISASCVAGSFSRAVTLTTGDGAKNVSVTQTDLAANTSPAASIVINLDTSAPLAPVITSPANNSYTNLRPQTLTGTCEGNLSLSITGNIVGAPVAATCVAGSFSQAITLTAVNGVKTVTVRQTDLAGNLSPTTSITLTLDNVRPGVYVNTLTATPTAVSPISFEIIFDEAVTGFVSADITVLNGTVTSFTGGPITYNILVTPTAPGDVTVNVAANVAVDIAGNLNTVSNSLTVVYQPSVLNITSHVDSASIIGSATVTVSGTCNVGGGNVSITGTAKTGGAVVGVCTGGGTFSINVTSVASGGPYTLIATQGATTDTVNSVWIHCAGAAMRSCAADGSGNPADPYMIANVTCLQEMRSGLTCNYALNNDIDASATSSWNFDGTNFRGWEPVPNDADTSIRFTGTLDGRNRIITNLYTTPRANNLGVGLFSRIYDEGNTLRDEQIFDLRLITPSFDLYDIDTPVGFIAGVANTISLRNVVVTNANADFTVDVVGDWDAPRYDMGLFIGKADNLSITQSSASGSMAFQGPGGSLLPDGFEKFDRIGGFIGHLSNSTVTNCSATSTMSSGPSNLHSFDYMGGGIGYVENSQVSRFQANSTMNLEVHTTKNTRSYFFIGGFAGRTKTANYSQICVNMNSDLESSTRTIDGWGGFVGDYEPGSGASTTDQISIRGTANFSSPSNLRASGFVQRDWGNTTISNVFVDLNVDVTNGIPGFNSDIFSGVINTYDNSSTYTNMLVISDHSTIVPGTTIFGFSGNNMWNFQLVSSGIFHANDDGYLPAPSDWPAPPDAITDSSLNLSLLPNGSYTGYDFVTVWQRDGVTNLPELQYCP